MIVAADSADATGNLMRITRVLAFHEHAVATKDGRGAMAFDDLPVVEIDLRMDAEAADDPGNRIP
jgi:hypothetical protein